MKKKVKIDTIIFDFDSTVLRGELLEILADFRLKNHPKREVILDKIRTITNLGMEGKIDFEDSLSRRLEILDLDESVIEDSRESVRCMINSEYFDLLPKIKDKKTYIISGGYKNVIDPLSEDLEVDARDIYAINLIFKNGNFSHFDKSSPLIKSDGKARVAHSIKNKGKVLMVGDGMTDYKVKELGGADYFAAYTGVVEREPVVKCADFILRDLRDLLEFIC